MDKRAGCTKFSSLSADQGSRQWLQLVGGLPCSPPLYTLGVLFPSLLGWSWPPSANVTRPPLCITILKLALWEGGEQTSTKRHIRILESIRQTTIAEQCMVVQIVTLTHTTNTKDWVWWPTQLSRNPEDGLRDETTGEGHWTESGALI